MPKSNVKDAVQDIAKALQRVFKDYTRHARNRAWDELNRKDGQKAIDDLLRNPSRPINSFKKLGFREWYEQNANIGESHQESEE